MGPVNKSRLRWPQWTLIRGDAPVDTATWDIVVLQASAPDYREQVWRTLHQICSDIIIVLAGDSYFDTTIRTKDHSGCVASITNHYLFGRRVLIQRVPIRSLLRAEVVIAELNPRVLTTWLILIARKIARRRTVLWGHALSRTGDSGERLRHTMRRCADCIVLYTDTEKKALTEVMPGADIVVAPNALLTRQEMRPRAGTVEACDFIYVGRLVEDKRPLLLLDALVQASPALEAKCKLLIVGDGPLRIPMQERANDLGIARRVEFFGHITDHARLYEIYKRALASVSPGYVGLSIIQSLGFGVPMIIAGNEPHSPEIEAAKEGKNAMYFNAGSAKALAAALIKMSSQATEWRDRAAAIADACRRDYSVETLAERLLESCKRPSERSDQ
jgi:glycosyltransferase involved in cell wall biosynthesis